MTKFIIKDDNGTEFEVTELEEEKEEEPSFPKETHDEESLSIEEISSLKSLIPFIDKILNLVNEKDEILKEEESLEDEDQDFKEEIEEPEKDSKTSVGSLEKPTRKDSVSLDLQENEATKSWLEKYKNIYQKR